MYLGGRTRARGCGWRAVLWTKDAHANKSTEAARGESPGRLLALLKNHQDKGIRHNIDVAVPTRPPGSAATAACRLYHLMEDAARRRFPRRKLWQWANARGSG